MALEQKLRLKLAQRLVMTPSLQQAIKLLQLSRLELEETLTQEILENPILDVEEQEEEAPQTEAPEAASETASTAASQEDDALPSAEETYADIDVEAFFADYLADGGRVEGPSMAFSSDSEVPLENFLSASPGLYDHLLWQLHLQSAPDSLVEVAEFIIGNLDEDGFLRATDEEIAEGTGAEHEAVVQAVELVQSLDPPGIATRSLRECLLTQVRVLEGGEIPEAEGDLLERVELILDQHFDIFLHQKWEALATVVGCEVTEFKAVLEIIQCLEPKPGRVYHQEKNAYIQPDVYIRKIDGAYTITLNDDGLPRLRINSRYARMLEGSSDPQVNSYLREKMRNAVWLMKSIDQRQRTIYKVAQSIVSFQRAFLDFGLEHLKPMVLRQVAEDIGMHESTISRVVSNKYMYTPRGLFPMKFFFHSGVDSARGENVSSLVVKERIRKLVEAEDSSRPLSDSKIMKMLQREGIRLARRTVAKYREEMNIPSSDKRKKVF